MLDLAVQDIANIRMDGMRRRMDGKLFERGDEIE